MSSVHWSVGQPVQIQCRQKNDRSLIAIIEESSSINRDLYASTMSIKSGFGRSIKTTIQQIKQSKRKISCDYVNLCFLVDCTHSMKKYINNLVDNIFNLVELVNSNNCKLRLAFIGYSDYNKDNVYQEPVIIPFTESKTDFRSQLTLVKTVDGIDFAEDVYSGMSAIKSLDWTTNTNIVFHICDFPGHGNKWLNNLSDRYQNTTTDYSSIFQSMAKRNIQYYFGRIGKHTDKMIADFKKQTTITEFDLNCPNQLANAIVKSIEISLLGLPKQKTTLMVKNDPKKCDIVTFAKPTKMSDLWEYIDLNPIKSSAYLTIDTEPFSEGVMRFAYHAVKYVGKNEHSMVIKKYKTVKDSDFVIYKYLSDQEMQVIAGYLVDEYNKLNVGINIKFLETFIVNYPLNNQYFSLEEKIDHTNYIKFTNNFGWINKSATHIDILTAFSHWTYHITDGYLMIVDLQGIEDNVSILLTDPAIHCDRHLTRFGPTNLGKKGFQSFFDKHTCNHICKSFKTL